MVYGRYNQQPSAYITTRCDVTTQNPLTPTSQYLCDLAPSPHVCLITRSGNRDIPKKRRGVHSDAFQNSLSEHLLLSMWTPGVIQAIIRNPQPLYRLPSHDVRVDDLIYIFRLLHRVPHFIGIHDHRRTMLTLIETTGLISANQFDPLLRQLRLESFMQFARLLWIAASTRMILRT
jgi:hypothetical protein